MDIRYEQIYVSTASREGEASGPLYTTETGRRITCGVNHEAVLLLDTRPLGYVSSDRDPAHPRVSQRVPGPSQMTLAKHTLHLVHSATLKRHVFTYPSGQQVE